MKKKWILCFLILAILFPGTVLGAQSPEIQIQGKIIEAQPPAYINNGRTFVPLRYVTEALDFQVDWVEETQSVIIAKNGYSTITMTIGKSHCRFGDKEISLDAPPEIRGDRTFVPLRFISEALGYKVRWDDNTKTVYID